VFFTGDLRMNTPEALLRRLDDIGASLAQTGRALALIGLGSVGVERSRLDEFSDLDFFVIAEDGCKASFIADLAWLRSAHPIAYSFQNTADGHKVLFADGIYCEFAVFEARELEAVSYAEGQIVWQAPAFDERLARPRTSSESRPVRALEWLLGEALTCLYVGLTRYRRGEKLTAFRFVQVYAVDRIVELAALLEQEVPGFGDIFSPERRFEQRFPVTAAALAPFMQGYEATPRSARAILDFLDRRFEVNPGIKAAIMGLCEECSEV
jgi:hypothetical protein